MAAPIERKLAAILSADAASRSILSFRSSAPASAESASTTSVTDGSPTVIVPVLSSTITPSRCAFSSASLFLNRMPFSAPMPEPTTTAVGVASPRAQGQAITSTATVLINHHRGSEPSAYRRRTPALLPLGWLVPRKQGGSEHRQTE